MKLKVIDAVRFQLPLFRLVTWADLDSQGTYREVVCELLPLCAMCYVLLPLSAAPPPSRTNPYNLMPSLPYTANNLPTITLCFSKKKEPDKTLKNMRHTQHSSSRQTLHQMTSSTTPLKS